MARVKQQGTLCCHLSVRGDSGRRWQLLCRRKVLRFWTLRAVCSRRTAVKHKPVLYFRKVNIHTPEKADTSYNLSPVSASFSLKLHLQMDASLTESRLSRLLCRFEKLKVMSGLFVVGFCEILIYSQYRVQWICVGGLSVCRSRQESCHRHGTLYSEYAQKKISSFSISLCLQYVESLDCILLLSVSLYDENS